jgi:ABC-type lipoprotein release transport system permease subunit
MFLYKLAFRDLLRNKRRTIFSMLALAIGLALLLLMAAVVRGEMNGALNTSIRLNTGHLQVQAGTYEEEKASLAWQDLIENPDQAAQRVAGLPVVKAASPRLVASGIVTQGDQSIGVRILGIEPESPVNAPFVEGVVQGSFITADDREGVVIGLPLAEKFGLKVGDTIQLMANTSNGDVDQQPFVVRGIFSTNTPTYDEGTLLMPLAKAQALTKTEGHASLIFVLLNNRADTGQATAALQSGALQIKTWEEMNSLITETENFAGAYMVLLYLIVLGITATVIVNTLIMAVFERTREIGILSALGMRASQIMGMFLAESSLLAVGGIILGLLLGAMAVTFAVQVGFGIGNIGTTGLLLGTRIYGEFAMDDAIQLTVLALIVTLIASLYPALLAARMEPVQALHEGQ